MRRTTLYLCIILIAATVITAFSTALNYRNALTASEDALKLQALGIAVGLEVSLAKIPPGQSTLFRDIVAEGMWEGVAFIALYDSNGETLLHSNEKLIGRKVKDDFINEAAAKDVPVYTYETLGTEEKVFILNFPVHLHQSAKVLKLAFHTYPAEKIIRQAGFQIVSILIVVVILWIVGFFFIKSVRRSEELQRNLEEQKRLALIGEMASVLAHEIRNPLGSIKGFAQFLIEEDLQARDADRSVIRDYLAIIVSESQRLEALTEDLLIYSKPVEVRNKSFDIRDLINETIQIFNQRSETKKIDVVMSIPQDLMITSDMDKIKQILMNLLQNAIDALPDGGFIEITAGARNKLLTVTIEDNGSGMDAETVQNALRPFFTTKTRGTGLGLAIVKRLLKALGGALDIKSQQGKGTKVTINIPQLPDMRIYGY